MLCVYIYDKKLITMNTCSPNTRAACKNKRWNEEVIHVMTSGACRPVSSEMLLHLRAIATTSLRASPGNNGTTLQRLGQFNGSRALLHHEHNAKALMFLNTKAVMFLTRVIMSRRSRG